MYTTFEYPVRILFHVEEQRKPYNFTNYSGIGRTCASSRYRAVFLLPRGLGTRLDLTSTVYTNFISRQERISEKYQTDVQQENKDYLTGIDV